MIKVFFDGVCEPINPGGVMGYGFAIIQDGIELYRESLMTRPTPGLKNTSNNVAEYQAVLSAMKWLKENNLQNKDILFLGDSKLVIEQMLGAWGIHKGLYVSYAYKAEDELINFPKTKWTWISRELNSVADEISKKPLIDAGVEFRIQPL